MAIKYHHFGRKVEESMIRIVGIDTQDRQADLLTTNLAKEGFLVIGNVRCRWQEI